MKAYEVKLSTLICGEIQDPIEAVARFCLEMNIPVATRDGLAFEVKDIDTGEITNIDMTED